MDGRTSYRLSEEIKVRLLFTSERLKVFTIDKAPGGNVAVGSTDFVIAVPGIATAVHSLTQPVAIACCGSRRDYLGRSPVQVANQGFDLKWIEWVTNTLIPPFSWHIKFKPGEYAFFAQTRNVMRG
jgi:hypothetical protein